MAPPGAGKTVMACAVIGKRKTPTLVLLHRKQILEQWKTQLSTFLNIPLKEIGAIANQKRKPTGRVDVGMLPTITKMADAEEVLSQYGQIIIDECHHIPAQSFETLLKKCSSKFILGLTATPYRADGHQAIIHMQCGPIRHEMKAVDGVPLRKRVIVRETAFKLPADLGPQPPIHTVWEHLVADQSRLNLVADDVIASVKNGRFPLIISERKQHLAGIAHSLAQKAPDIAAKGYLFTGELGKKARSKLLGELKESLTSGEKPYILATGAFIGEGFDLPALDTLLVAMPVSFKGKLIQYAGRLHRPFSWKSEVVIYDYADTSSPLTISMFRKRVHAYQKMDYAIETPPNFRWHLKSNRTNQIELFQGGRVSGTGKAESGM